MAAGSKFQNRRILKFWRGLRQLMDFENPLSTQTNIFADVAQLAEQLTCNQQVNGSSPFIGFIAFTVYCRRGRRKNVFYVACLNRG